MSLADSVSAEVGIEKIVSLPVSLLFSVLLLVFLKKNGLLSKYGFCKSEVRLKKMLYYIPVILMLTANLWCIAGSNLPVTDTVFYILTMFCVGFLEELIFRGFLFTSMKKDNLKSAVIISSLTFGIGHIINLINGSGASVLENLLQVLYASAAGFMFVMIFYKSKSLIICIISHGAFNALSVFTDEAAVTNQHRIISAVFLTVLCCSYGLYLCKIQKKRFSE